MNGNERSQPGKGTHARFPSQTQWTLLVQRAADPLTPESQQALNQLCQTYWFPIYAFIRSQRLDSHHAKDLVQGFFVHLLEGNLIQQASRERGRFRTFLLGCLRNFIKDEWRKDNALKRGGSVTIFSIDDTDAEERFSQLPMIQPAPEAAFDRTWAATVIEEAMRRLRQHHAEQGRIAVFEAMQGCVRGELLPASYPELAARLGMPKGTFEVALSRFKKDFGRMVRSLIAETVEPSEVNDEIRHLMSAWSAYLTEKP